MLDSYHTEFEDWSNNFMEKCSANLDSPETVEEKMQHMKNTKSGLRLQEGRYQFLHKAFS